MMCESCYIKIKLFLARFIVVILLMLPLNVFAGVFVHDKIALEGKVVMLSAKAMRGFFSEGGMLLEFSVSGKTLGRTLSGGDSIAHMEYLPKAAGLFVITASSGDESGKGWLLVTGKADRLLLVDVREALFRDPVGNAVREGAQDALKELSGQYRIVYLRSGLYPRVMLDDWLDKKGFTGSIMLDLEKGRLVRKLKSAGFVVAGVVGGPEAAISVKGEKTRVITFEKAEGARQVKNWQEVRDALGEDK